MKIGLLNRTADVSRHDSSPEQTHLAQVSPLMGHRRCRTLLRHPRWMLAAWTGLLALSILTVALYTAGTPVYFARVSTLCANCVDERLTPSSATALHTLGVSTEVYAAYWTAINILFALVYFGIAAFILWRKPGDRVTVVAALAFLAMGASFPDIPMALAVVHPAWWLPVTLLNACGFPTFITFLFLFPTGRFVPGYTRWVASGFAVAYLLRSFLPGFFPSHAPWFRVFSLLMTLVVFAVCVYAQIYRYRRISTQVERQQTKWVIFGVTSALSGFLLVAYVPLAMLQLFSPAQRLPLLLSVSLVTSVYLLLLLIPLAVAIGILRSRLWDIDLIINRTLVYGALTASIVGSYVVVVVSFGMLLRTGGSLLTSLFATGLIAVLVQPLRELLQRSVNHLLYGQRDEPYVVIARLSQRLKETLAPDAALATITETVAQSLKLPYVAIQWKDRGAFALEARYGEPADELITLPLIYQAETIGQLQLAPRSPGETFTPADRRLLEELARQAGLAMHAVRLASALQQARERLVLAREEERRRLRRELHDSVGPTLASLSQRIDTACYLISDDPSAAIALLGTLKAQIKTTIGEIRRVVYSLRPPILDELGLVSALREHALQSQVAKGLLVSVEMNGDLPVLSAAVEVAAYRISVEAITNVERHADAHHCVVRLEAPEGHTLSLAISDDGSGLPDEYHAGVGITSMRERVAELGGVCDITAVVNGGTCVSVQLPLQS